MEDESPICPPLGLLPELVLGCMFRADKPLLSATGTCPDSAFRPVESGTPVRSIGPKSIEPKSVESESIESESRDRPESIELARDWQIGRRKKGGGGGGCGQSDRAPL